MSRKFIDSLLILTLALWLIPWQGKQYFPQILGGHYVQWICSILLALMIPLGSLLTLSFMLRDSTKRRYGFFTIICFSFPLLVNLFILGISQPTIIHTQLTFQGIGRDNLAIRSLFEATLRAESIQKRKRAAQILYQNYGIETAFIDEDETFKRYYPTQADVDQWEKRQLDNKEISSMQEYIHYQLKQLPWSFTLYLGTYAIIMTIGLAVFSFKKSTNKPME